MRRITLVLVLFLAPVALHAATMITSFGPSSSAIISGQSLGLSWAASEASGVSILLPCISGVRYRDEAGTAVSCGSKRTGFSKSGTMTLQVTNTGGGTVSVSPTIYPINLNGVEVAAAAETASFSVAASVTDVSSAELLVITKEAMLVPPLLSVKKTYRSQPTGRFSEVRTIVRLGLHANIKFN